jgi:probable HAF family extracellular repeat protein
MNALLRPAVAALVLAPLAVCAFSLRFASDPAGLAGLRHLLREARRDDDLRRLERATLRREEARRQVVQELLAGRCGLGEALGRFRELDREWPDCATPLPKALTGAWASEEERHYWLLTKLVQDLLGERPEELAAALGRLEEDYRQLRAGRPAPPVDLGTLGGTNSSARGINRSGQIVGGSDTSSVASRAFLWVPTTPNGTSGTMVDLNTLIGSSAISLEAATGIHDQGQIVGEGVLKSHGSRHAFPLTPTSTTTALTRPASSTPTASTASPTVAPGGDPSLAPVLARPTSGSTNFGPTTVSVALPLPQPPAAAAAAPGPAPLLAQAPLFVPPLTSNLPPTGPDTGSPHPVGTSAAAADRALAGLDAELSSAPVGEDLALPGSGAVPTP